MDREFSYQFVCMLFAWCGNIFECIDTNDVKELSSANEVKDIRCVLCSWLVRNSHSHKQGNNPTLKLTGNSVKYLYFMLQRRIAHCSRVKADVLKAHKDYRDLKRNQNIDWESLEKTEVHVDGEIFKSRCISHPDIPSIWYNDATFQAMKHVKREIFDPYIESMKKSKTILYFE